MPVLIKAPVLLNEQVGPGIFLMKVHAPAVTAECKPGQFVHVRTTSERDPLLRRPFSIYRKEKDAGNLQLLYEIRGKGTSLMAGIRAGENLDLMGPLGRGWNLDRKPGTVIVIGGGMGTASLLALVEEFCSRKGFKIRAFLGFREKKLVIGAEIFARAGAEVTIATDDGSCGYRGPITDLLPRSVRGTGPFYIYACGPQAMLRRVAEFCELEGIVGEVSLDHRMACGTGACLGCSCRVKKKDSWTYSRTCVEGPVFTTSEVLWDG